MELTLEPNTVDGVAVGIARGRLSLADLEQAVTAMWDAVEGPDLRILWDFREARFDLDPPEVRAIANFVRAHAPPVRLRTAMIVSNDLDFGLSRMFEVIRETENAETRVFRDEREARAWLASP